jgi:hypothetical protein
VLLLLFEPGALALHFLLGFALLAELLLFFPFELLLLGQLLAVVAGEGQLVFAQLVVGAGDVDVHRLTEAGDRRRDLAEAFLRRVEFVWLQSADEVVGLGVVGAQHQLREVADHFAALRQ